MTAKEAPTVLIVEDDSELAALYAAWLDDSFEVIKTNTCHGAYEHFNQPIDIALLDRELPDGSGDEILKCIRADNLGWQVAMITGIDPSLDLLHLQCNEYLTKPVERTEFLNTVNRLVTQARLGGYITEYNSLTRRIQLLEDHCPAEDLQSSKAYHSLERRREKLQSLLDSSTTVLPPTLRNSLI